MHKDKIREGGAAHLGFLFDAYKPEYFYFEVYELLRKLAQTSLVAFLLPNSAAQIVLTLMLCFVTTVAMEVSSVGIDECRVEGIPFRACRT